jgi:hypothetical protein
MAVIGSCLCGDVAWEAYGALEFMHHCHCGRCRKTHGTAFATDLMSQAADVRLLRGGEQIERYESSPGAFKLFCRRCGSAVTDGQPAWQDFTFMPAGPFESDPGLRPVAHIFVASKAPWYEIRDDLPRFDAFPTGVDATVLPDLTPPLPATAGAIRGSCLCGGVAYLLEAGAATGSQNCHCTRCRKVRGTPHASNLFTSLDSVHIVRGEELLASYKMPDARYFRNVFCRRCGSPMPRLDSERGIAVIAMGSFDDDPGTSPRWHIYVGSKAPWFDIADDLPQHDAGPPSA